jgi:hypothetical protein
VDEVAGDLRARGWAWRSCGGGVRRVWRQILWLEERFRPVLEAEAVE